MEFADLKDQRRIQTVIEKPMSSGELEKLAEDAMSLAVQIGDLEAELKVFSEQIKAKLKPLEASFKHLTELYKTRSITSEEDVTVGFDWNTGMKWLLTDDGTILGPYTITEEDKQMPIPQIADVRTFTPRNVEIERDEEPEPEVEVSLPDPVGKEVPGDPEAVLACEECGSPTKRRHLRLLYGLELCFVCAAKVSSEEAK